MEIRRAANLKTERRTGAVFETQAHKRAGFSEPFDDKVLSTGEVVFAPRERTNIHQHTVCQMIYITSGTGIVATVDEEFVVSEGDWVSIPPDEPHWHVATDTEEFRHISIVIRDPEHDGTVALSDE
ncbi:cupin domain-containing protein [Halegenticoccus tardaugens]|uniref:cupin domain-containing protein n=1 Tax=Halegenticoccus tardaugens TaxID=2071624 RepID=UPI00100B044E|nr:cupin domain-containing protein [Halegenticoccus tardaugens]